MTPERIANFNKLRKAWRARLPNLQRGQRQLDELAFDDALVTLRLFVALDPPPPAEERARAQRLLAASLVYLDRATQAELRRLLLLDPKATLDPALFPPPALERFDALKAAP